MGTKEIIMWMIADNMVDAFDISHETAELVIKEIGSNCDDLNFEETCELFDQVLNELNL